LIPFSARKIRVRRGLGARPPSYSFISSPALFDRLDAAGGFPVLSPSRLLGRGQAYRTAEDRDPTAIAFLALILILPRHVG
jgi:hypothetical protein